MGAGGGMVGSSQRDARRCSALLVRRSFGFARALARGCEAVRESNSRARLCGEWPGCAARLTATPQKVAGEREGNCPQSEPMPELETWSVAVPTTAKSKRKLE